MNQILFGILAIALLSVTSGFGQASLQFSATRYTVAENADNAFLTIQRTGEVNSEASVNYETIDGTATAGQKYTAVSSTLVFRTQETNKTIAVPILNNGFTDGAQSFRVALSNPTGGAVLGARTNATVSIADNDQGVSFLLPPLPASENAGSVRVQVDRWDDAANPVSVTLFTSDLTGISAVDYTGITNTLTFSPLEAFQFVDIPILNNTTRQENRTFRVHLIDPVNTSLGKANTVTVTILDNDQGFAFEMASYSVSEDAGVALMDVLRGTDDMSSTLTVEWSTADITAATGTDYTGTNRKLVFAAGDRMQQVAIPILNDGVRDCAPSLSSARPSRSGSPQ